MKLILVLLGLLCLSSNTILVSANNAQTFMYGTKILMNIDGQTVVHSGMQDSLDSMIGSGLTSFRHFIRRTPTSNIGGYSGVNPPTQEEFSQPFPLAHYAISKGLKVILGCGDVTGNQDVNDTTLPMYIAQVTRCAQLIGNESFPAGSVAVEWANELAGGDNTFWNPVNLKMNQLLRSILPDTPIVLKGCNWGYYSNNIDGSLMKPLDDNFIFAHHSYTMQSQDDANTMAKQIESFWQQNGYAGAIFEEAGFNNGNDGSFNQDIWEGNYIIWTNAFSPYNMPLGMWAITMGGDFRANDEGDTVMPRQTVSDIINWDSNGGGHWNYSSSLLF